MDGVVFKMAKRQKVSEYIKSMPTSRFIETPPNQINDTNRADLSHIVSRMAAVANKRLKAMEEKGIKYSSSQYPDVIAGVRKFVAAGKTLGQLRAEYKRLYGFLNSKMSTLTGRVTAYYEAKKRTAEKEGREYTQSFREARKEYYESESARKSFDNIGDMFAAMRHENWLARYGLAGLDSKQVKEVFEEVSLSYGNTDDMSTDDWHEMMNDAIYRLRELSDANENYQDDVSTSQFI